MQQNKENNPSGVGHPHPGYHTQASNTHTTFVQYFSLIHMILLTSSIEAPIQA
jgi:hypothetical protein